MNTMVPKEAQARELKATTPPPAQAPRAQSGPSLKLFNQPLGGWAQRGVKAALFAALGVALLWQGAADVRYDAGSLVVASSAVSGGCALFLGALCILHPALYASALVNVVEVAFIYVLLTLNWALHHSKGVLPIDQRLVLAAHLLIGIAVGHSPGTLAAGSGFLLPAYLLLDYKDQSARRAKLARTAVGCATGGQCTPPALLAAMSLLDYGPRGFGILFLHTASLLLIWWLARVQRLAARAGITSSHAERPGTGLMLRQSVGVMAAHPLFRAIIVVALFGIPVLHGLVMALLQATSSGSQTGFSGAHMILAIICSLGLAQLDLKAVFNKMKVPGARQNEQTPGSADSLGSGGDQSLPPGSAGQWSICSRGARPSGSLQPGSSTTASTHLPAPPSELPSGSSGAPLINLLSSAGTNWRNWRKGLASSSGPTMAAPHRHHASGGTSSTGLPTGPTSQGSHEAAHQHHARHSSSHVQGSSQGMLGSHGNSVQDHWNAKRGIATCSPRSMLALLCLGVLVVEFVAVAQKLVSPGRSQWTDDASASPVALLAFMVAAVVLTQLYITHMQRWAGTDQAIYGDAQAINALISSGGGSGSHSFPAAMPSGSVSGSAGKGMMQGSSGLERPSAPMPGSGSDKGPGLGGPTPDVPLRLGRLLGAGSFGRVYQGVWEDKVAVAVKIILHAAAQAVKIQQEAALCMSVHHRNVVSTIHCFTTEEAAMRTTTELQVRHEEPAGGVRWSDYQDISGENNALAISTQQTSAMCSTWIVQEYCAMGSLADHLGHLRKQLQQQHRLDEQFSADAQVGSSAADGREVAATAATGPTAPATGTAATSPSPLDSQALPSGLDVSASAHVDPSVGLNTGEGSILSSGTASATAAASSGPAGVSGSKATAASSVATSSRSKRQHTAASIQDAGAPKESDDVSKAMFIMLDVARGMAYLHTHGVCHGDLKAQNVLLCEDPEAPCGICAKICDFGLSRVLLEGATHMSTATHGTVTHMAPELLLDGRLSYAADVYAFGVLMWEAVSGERQVYPGMAPAQMILRVTSRMLRPTFPIQSSGVGEVGARTEVARTEAFTGRVQVAHDYCDLARRCWLEDPTERPSFPEIVGVLERMLNMRGLTTTEVLYKPRVQQHHGGGFPSGANAQMPMGGVLSVGPSRAGSEMPSASGSSRGLAAAGSSGLGALGSSGSHAPVSSGGGTNHPHLHSALVHFHAAHLTGTPLSAVHEGHAVAPEQHEGGPHA